MDGPEVFTKWLGESEEAIRHIFRVARQLAPSIIFFDQLDALAPHCADSDSGSRTTERVVNQLLAELDGMESAQGNVIVIAATNRLDLVDPSVLRPGRLGTHLYTSAAQPGRASGNLREGNARARASAAPCRAAAREPGAADSRLLGRRHSRFLRAGAHECAQARGLPRKCRRSPNPISPPPFRSSVVQSTGTNYSHGCEDESARRTQTETELIRQETREETTWFIQGGRAVFPAIRTLLLSRWRRRCSAMLPAQRADAADNSYDINVILPLTGGASFLGKGEQKSLQLLEGVVNERRRHRRPAGAVHLPRRSIEPANRRAARVTGHRLAVRRSSSARRSSPCATRWRRLVRDGPVMYCFSPGIHPEAGSLRLHLERLDASCRRRIHPLLPPEGLEEGRVHHQHRRHRPGRRGAASRKRSPLPENDIDRSRR